MCPALRRDTYFLSAPQQNRQSRAYYEEISAKGGICLPKPTVSNRLLRGGWLLLRRYWGHRVATHSAALAFYLLFSVFPFLLFISSLIGLLQLDAASLLRPFSDVLPKEILRLAEGYLLRAGQDPSLQRLLWALALSVYFPMRATNALLRCVRTAYRLGTPSSPWRHWCKTLLYTLLLMTAIAATLILFTASDRLLTFGVRALHLSPALPRLWALLRLPLAAAVGYFALFSLYALAQDRSQAGRNLHPGAAAALCAWLPASCIYSLYVRYAADYSVLYGSIGTAIVLLMWLYITAVILIMGAEWNGVLIHLRRMGASGQIS